MRLTALLLPLALASACSSDSRDHKDGDALRLDWSTGQSWQVAARYHMAGDMGEELPTDLETGESLGEPVGEHWTEEAVWTYQVVETGLVPDDRDELYPYALERGEVRSLAVIKARVDATLNDDPALLERDPVIYLVFREDQDRLAAIVSFENVDGERVEHAWSSTQLDRSWSVLSQSALTSAPTYLAPSAARWEDGSRMLENGHYVDTERVDGDVLDVFFDDELGGGLVISRYESGAPWPTEVLTDNLEARLLSSSDVSLLRSARMAVDADIDEDFDYRAALGASIDIDASLSLSADEIAAGGFDAAAREGYRPWAGNWWPLRQAELVWGYDGRDTYSQRIKEQVDPIKESLDAISKDLRDMKSGDDGYDDKVQEYRDKQQELITVLVDFYGGLQQDLDSGLITLQDGQILHAGGGEVGAEGWSYDLDELSPMDKLALSFYVDDATGSTNPFYLPAWEILNSYNPDGEGWWGHCNGWSGAAILANEPRQSVQVSMRGQDVEFTTADLKGLLTESHYSTTSHFYGQRYNGEEDDITDLSPAAFHRLVSFYIRDQGVGMVFDTTADEQVWNFPAWAVDLVIEETTDPALAELVNINTATEEALDELPGIGETLSARIVEYREDNGPFQSTDEIMDVRGIGQGTYDDLADLITVDALQRSFDVVAEVTLTTDGVDVDWVDGSSPESFTETWGYTLKTDADGRVLEGTWDREDEHPDFAWIPYSNPHSAQTGGSENPYLPYGKLLDVIGEDFERH